MREMIGRRWLHQAAALAIFALPPAITSPNAEFVVPVVFALERS